MKLPNTNVAKNVIIFVGDGMSMTTVTGKNRILSGKLQDQSCIIGDLINTFAFAKYKRCIKVR